MSKENEKTLTLEERFAHLEQIVARMEDVMYPWMRPLSSTRRGLMR